MKVVYFYRKPHPFHKSIEFIFDNIRNRIPPQVNAIKKEVSWYSEGIVKRIKIIIEASHNQGSVNHITGDIHFAALLLKRERTILTIHDCRMLSESKGIKYLLLKYFWFTLPLKKVRFVTVVSETTKKELLKYVKYDPKKIKTIPVAISASFCSHPQVFNKTCPTILQVGTTSNKNIERLVEAIRNIPCKLVIIGELNDDIKRKLTECRTEYINKTNLAEPDLINEYVACDFVSFVSTYEGFGMPILEAQTVGRVVLTSNISSMPEVSGGAACMVNPFDSISIRQGVLKIINDDVYRETLIQQGLENVKRFQLDKIINQYLDLYRQIEEESC